MGEHVAEPAGVVVQASQVVHSARAVLRTVVEVGVPAFSILLVFGPQVLQIVADELGGKVPEGLTGWLLGAAAGITAVAAIITKVLSLPGLQAALAKVKLSAKP